MLASRKKNARTKLVVGLMMAAVVATAAPALAQGQGGDAQIDVTFSDDGKSVTINSTKGLSNIIIEDCFGVTHKHEIRGEVRNLTHNETFVIAGVWVKSGANSDPDGPPGAGERFDNPNAETLCEEENGNGNGAPPCPTNVLAIANQDGTITVSWDNVTDADVYRVYRGTDPADLDLIETTTDTQFVDDDTVVGTTYFYMVTAVVDGVESENCAIVSATAIPFFPGAAGFVLAAAGCLAAFTLLRRRN